MSTKKENNETKSKNSYDKQLKEIQAKYSSNLERIKAQYDARVQELREEIQALQSKRG